MILFLVISFLSGMVLGQRFRFLALIPAIIFAILATIGVGIGRAHDVWWIVLSGISVITCLQIGYIVGCGIRSFIVTARDARPSSSGHASPAFTRAKTVAHG
jgi:hypothetical protein